MARINYNCTDDDGHKFLVPEDLIDEFDQLLELCNEAQWGSDEWYTLNAEFNKKFQQYMVG